MMDWVIGWVAAGGYPAIAVLMFLENLVPPIPSEVIMPLAGFTAARGSLSLAGVVLAGVIGTVLGNAVWYEIARGIGIARIRPFVERHGRWLALGTAELDRAERTLRRYGPVAIAFGRLLPGIRTLISVPAGVFLIERKVFYVWTTVGTVAWVGFLAVAGYGLEEHYHRVEGWLEPLGLVVASLALLAYGAHLVLYWRRAGRED